MENFSAISVNWLDVSVIYLFE